MKQKTRKKDMQKKIVIIGASSGMGQKVAEIFINKGYKVGLGARRIENLMKIKEMNENNVECEKIDVTDEKADESLIKLIDKIGGMDILFLASGVGFENNELDIRKELHTVKVNCEGFVRMVDSAFNYFKTKEKGQIAIISSIAGTKGLGTAPSYSSTKRFQNIYLTSLEQLCTINNYNIRFTDIRPGFVDTDLLDTKKKYPLLMKKEYVAKTIVKSIENQTRIKIIDWKYNIIVFFWRLIPQCLWVRLSIKTKRKS